MEAVDPNAIKKYLMESWYNKKTHIITYGINMKTIYGNEFHVCVDKKALMFNTKSEAIKEVKRLNKELRAAKSPIELPTVQVSDTTKAD
jgi:hypothetical protein